MKKGLYFENQLGQQILVNSNVAEADVVSMIYDYVKKLNPSYHIYYIQITQGNPITYDVGSHIEFFKYYK